MRRGILSDTARIGALTACVKVSGALKTVLIARSFGAGDSMDAYLAAFLIPSFAGDVLAGAISPALLPILVEVRERQSSRDARELASRVLAAATTLLALVAVITAALSWPALHLLASGFNVLKLKVTQSLLLVMLPILPLSAVAATFRTLLHAEERFAAAALAPMLTPLAIVTAIFLFKGSRALAIGTVVGAALEVTLLAAVLWRFGLLVAPRWRGTSAALRRVLAEYAPVASSYLILGGSTIVDQSLAATLGSGSVSALNYGTRLVTVILSVGSSSLGTAVLPRFSKLAAAGQWMKIRTAFRSLTLLSLAITVPLTLLLVVLSEPLVRLLFQHGAFTAGASHFVGGVQAFSLLQIPFSVLLVLVVRLVSSFKVNRLLFHLAVFSLLANVLFDLLLMPRLGVAGIALSTTLVHATGLAYLAWALFRSKPWKVLDLRQPPLPAAAGGM